LAGPPSHRKGARISRPFEDSKVESDPVRKSRGGVRTEILYFNSEPVLGKYVDIIRQRGHDVVVATTEVDALTMMRIQIFDTLVIDCAQDRLYIQNFTAKAQGLQPSLAVFLADEWGDELVTGLDELEHVLTMLEDDECALLAIESQRA
jgi:hypothetical protein